MSHPLVDQFARMRLRRRHTDAVIFVMSVSAGLALLVTAALLAPVDWTPF